MANPAFVQSTTGTPGGFVTSVTTSAFGSSTTTGNALLVIANSTHATDITTVTDNQSNNYNLLKLSSRTSLDLEMWLALNITGGASHTVTVNDSSSQVGNIIVFEISGLPTSGYVLDSYGIFTNGNSVASPSVTAQFQTNNANDILIGAFTVGVTSSVTYTVGSGYSNLTTVAGNTWSDAMCAETQVVSSIGTYSASVGGQTTAQLSSGIIVALSNTVVKSPTQLNDYEFLSSLDNGNGVISVSEKIR